MDDVALLTLRAMVGALLVGHGAQKLFGRFGAGGLPGTAAFLGSLGLRPAGALAVLAGLSEFGGGLLTVLGLLSPLGAVGILASMAMAIATVHRGKPIWADRGGGELPLTNAAVATALILAGSGRYSLDQALGLALPDWVALAAVAGAAVTIWAALATRDHDPRPVPGAVASTDELRRPA